MGNNREFLLAIALSILVLVGWQYFIGGPQLERQKQRAAQQQQQSQQQAETPAPGTAVPGTPVPGTPVPGTPATDAPAPSVPSPQASSPGGSAPAPSSTAPSSVPAAPGTAATAENSRAAIIAASPRVPIETESLSGSINLKGARVDDLKLNKYHVTVKPGSPDIVLLSPAGTPGAFYAEHGWTGDPAAKLKLPTGQTEWTLAAGKKLTAATPVTLTWDNGEGLVFSRRISIDEDYLITIEQSVENAGGEAVTLYPYGLVSRHGTPKVQSFYILHEGLVGVLGEDGLTEIDYDDIKDDKLETVKSQGGWLGITDKYWAVVLVPDQAQKISARFSDNPRGTLDIYQTDYLVETGVTVPAGGTASATTDLFAGAKVVDIVDRYDDGKNIRNFDLLIDWGWFYFLTKPLFQALHFIYGLVGNFGVAILILTVMVKLVFFPLANKSYVSMSKMKKLQPEMTRIRERYADDKVRQQQAMMEMYKKEKVNPASGCLPIIVQIPVFFALYKVLFVTIEMRHTPFFGWIHDLAAPDPTTVFNLFGAIPWAPPSFLMIGVWPLIMGVTMWLQMRLNPAPADPIQAQIFNWMPIVFTFLLARFPAGLVIYWAWNNTLSIAQQSFIMHRQGVKIELFGNIRNSLPFLNSGGGGGKKDGG